MGYEPQILMENPRATRRQKEKYDKSQIKKRRNKAETVPGVSVAAELRDSHQIEFDKDAL